MATLPGDAAIPASVVPSLNVNANPGAGNLALGSAGFVFYSGGNGTYVSNNGGAANGSVGNFREVRPGSSGLFGKLVQLTGKPPLFRGAVIVELQVELDDSGGDGTLTECVYVQSEDGFRFLALASGVEEV